MHNRRIIGLILFVFGIVVLVWGLMILDSHPGTLEKVDKKSVIFLIVGGGSVIFGCLLSTNHSIKEFYYLNAGIKFSDQGTEPKEQHLEPTVKQERQNFSANLGEIVPGSSAPEFHVLEEELAISVTPCSDPMAPMYMLDKNFRIIEWNDAFSICFDRTMEGRRGLNVLEWTYFLDNYEDVLQHGVKAFSDPENFPRIDVETIKYTSRTYGVIKGIKRAYQIPSDNGDCLGWLITIEPEFEQADMALKYHEALFCNLRLGLMWSEYALSYDVVLNSSNIYPHLINTVIGEIGSSGPKPILANTKILDLGAGTGNITVLLANPAANRLVVALEKNLVMLNILRRKCKFYLRQDAEGPGVIAIKQDIRSLFGLQSGFFDYVIVNNVLYSFNDEKIVKQCISEMYRVLKPGGEVRISEPHKKANVSKVLSVIKKEIQIKGIFSEIEPHFNKVKEINEFSLSPMLRKWDINEMEDYLLDIGFSEITYREDKIYAKQSFIICAHK